MAMEVGATFCASKGNSCHHAHTTEYHPSCNGHGTKTPIGVLKGPKGMTLRLYAPGTIWKDADAAAALTISHRKAGH